ncbi:hypothetical protein OUZ56_033229 [Daphnia magna]|uniref:Uncharacterized protein n=1 Tax=Daphnia magna TaxID=35525 RepID=A0ABQ9ZXG1_9CRUS|nr:hypothetical protein OUZ56_033229 [Daphnia magna]
MPKRTNQLLPSCLRDPSRRLHPLRELSSVPVETSPIPASSLESGTSFVGEALNFEGPIPKDHLTKEADSQGILSSRKDKLWKLSENLLARQSSEKIQKKMRTNGWSALNNILPTTDGKISTVGSPVLKKGDLSRVKREIGYLFAEMSHPLLGQRCDRGEEIIGRSPL